MRQTSKRFILCCFYFLLKFKFVKWPKKLIVKSYFKRGTKWCTFRFSLHLFTIYTYSKDIVYENLKFIERQTCDSTELRVVCGILVFIPQILLQLIDILLSYRPKATFLNKSGPVGQMLTLQLICNIFTNSNFYQEVNYSKQLLKPCDTIY